MIPFLFLILSFFTSFISSKKNFTDISYQTQSVIAQKGDGVFSLLRRYHLKQYKCNVNKFYDLNQLTKEDMLISGNEYKIPVYVFEYNGKSIRSTIGINDYAQALRIKEYNDLLLESNLRRNSYVESKLLLVPHHEIFCEKVEESNNNEKKEILKKPMLQVDLFGEAYRNVEVVDNALAGQVYYIVSGHGGPDPGARCTSCSNTLCEDEYAYDVSLRLARDLMQHGATVEVIVVDNNDGIRDEMYLKCDYDEIYLGNHKIQRDQITRLGKRADIINNLYQKHKNNGAKKQVAIMIHVDSNSSHKRQDVYFYYCPGSNSGKQLAVDLKNTFERKYALHQKNRGYKGFVRQRNLYMLRNTLPSAVYIELANIRNSSDHKRLTLNSNRQALANWIFESLINI